MIIIFLNAYKSRPENSPPESHIRYIRLCCCWGQDNVLFARDAYRRKNKRVFFPSSIYHVPEGGIIPWRYRTFFSTKYPQYLAGLWKTVFTRKHPWAGWSSLERRESSAFKKNSMPGRQRQFSGLSWKRFSSQLPWVGGNSIDERREGSIFFPF